MHDTLPSTPPQNSWPAIGKTRSRTLCVTNEVVTHGIHSTNIWMHDSSSSYGEQQWRVCGRVVLRASRSIEIHFFSLFLSLSNLRKIRIQGTLRIQFGELHFHWILSIFARTDSARQYFKTPNSFDAKSKKKEKTAQNRNDNLLYYKLFLTTPTSGDSVSFFFFADASAHCFIYCLSSFVVKFLSEVGGVLNRDLCLSSSPLTRRRGKRIMRIQHAIANGTFAV